MTSQLLTVTVHNPRVEDVNRVVGRPDLLAITLGNGEYHGHVTLLVSDADWNAISMAVSAFLDGENDSGTRPGDHASIVGKNYSYVAPVTDYNYEGGSGD